MEEHRLRVKSIILWDMTPCSPLRFSRRFGGTYRLHLQGQRNRFRKPASKQIVETQRTTRRHIPEDDTLHNHRCKNLESYIDWGCLRTECWGKYLDRDEVIGGWSKLHNEELRNLYCSPSIIRIIKSRRIRWAGHLARMGAKDFGRKEITSKI
jgi:hypothetical protein